MPEPMSTDAHGPPPIRRRRADAERNAEAVREAARTVFRESGVDAPAKQIADLAGVGVGTLYRHYPRRSDLVKAVFRGEVDACADAAPALSASHAPDVALELWLLRFTEFLAAKRGLVAALHSGDPAFDELPGYFSQRFYPTLDGLLSAAQAAGEIDGDVSAEDLLYAVTDLSHGPGRGSRSGPRMVSLLVDGLRYRGPRHT